MKIFVISLAGSTDRRESVRQQFARVGVAFNFFDGIPGKNAAQRYFEGTDQRLYRLNTYRDPLDSEVGCYASHLELWKHSAATNEPLLILEDDCQLDDDFATAVTVVGSLIDRYKFLRLQDFHRQTAKLSSHATGPIQQVGKYSIRYLPDVPLCLLAYAVHPVAAAKLAGASKILTAPVDKFMQRIWEHEVPIYALDPAPVRTSSHATNSTIGDRSNKHKTPALMLGRAAYKLRGELSRARFNKAQRKAIASSGETPT